jgi:hypothetical protein
MNATGTKWGDDTNPMYTKNRDVPKNLRTLIKDRGKIVSVLADGHCLFTAVGKMLHMGSGTVMKEAKAHMISRPSDEGYHYVSGMTKATRVTRYTEFEKVKQNERGPDIHELEWGGTEDYQIIAR